MCFRRLKGTEQKRKSVTIDRLVFCRNGWYNISIRIICEMEMQGGNGERSETPEKT